MTLSLRKSSIIVAVACAVLAGPAIAKGKPDHAKKPHGQDHSSDFNVGIDISIGDSERRLVRDYYSSRANCPPGLAKKRNGCLPPGIAKKRYEVGRPIYDDAIIVELPHDITVRLPPLSAGREYRVVDGDLVVVAIGTMVVLDAIGVF